MKIHFVFPSWTRLLESRPELKAEISGYDLGSFRMASLGIPTAAAALPADVEVSFVDENVETVDFDVDADAIALSFFTPQATHAYHIADEFRARGHTVLAGGIHPTMLPDETLEHVDAVVIGEVEGLWETLLADLGAGRLKPRYRRQAGAGPLSLAPARRDLFHRSAYLRTGVVQIARGCPRDCSYCVIPHCYGRAIRFRPVADVVADIATLPYPTYFIADENVLFADRTNVTYARELLQAIRANGERRFFYFATYPHMLQSADPTVLDLFAPARCRQIYLILGLEAPLRDELRQSGLLDRLSALRDQGINIMASFTLGHDEDDPDSGALVEAFTEQADLNLAEFIVTTPYPGTPQFRQLQQQGRLLTREWARFNGANVVFKPRHFTEQQLLDLYLGLWKRFYRDIGQQEMLKRYMRGFSRSILERPV